MIILQANKDAQEPLEIEFKVKKTICPKVLERLRTSKAFTSTYRVITYKDSDSNSLLISTNIRNSREVIDFIDKLEIEFTEQLKKS